MQFLLCAIFNLIYMQTGDVSCLLFGQLSLIWAGLAIAYADFGSK